MRIMAGVFGHPLQNLCFWIFSESKILLLDSLIRNNLSKVLILGSFFETETVKLNHLFRTNCFFANLWLIINVINKQHVRIQKAVTSVTVWPVIKVMAKLAKEANVPMPLALKMKNVLPQPLSIACVSRQRLTENQLFRNGCFFLLGGDSLTTR